MNVTVIGMIYKSPIYLDFMIDQMDRYCTSKKHNVNTMIIGNDPNESIIAALTHACCADQTLIYKDPKPNDFYLNRVYRAWNVAGMNADGDVIVFINSDMGLTEGWLDKLLYHLNPYTIPCSRLIESGKMPSGKYGISKNFGKTVTDYKEKEFLEYAASVSEDKIMNGGLYMPCAFYKDEFVESGGYPEGNIYLGGVGNVSTPFMKSGDAHYFHDKMRHKQHMTVFDSLVYHFQEGELDE